MKFDPWIEETDVADVSHPHDKASSFPSSEQQAELGSVCSVLVSFASGVAASFLEDSWPVVAVSNVSALAASSCEWSRDESKDSVGSVFCFSVGATVAGGAVKFTGLERKNQRCGVE